jgi:fumarylpyruvate hydrolase
MTPPFDIPATPQVPINGITSGGYPVRRIFCVGRNYADHARELGNVVDRDAPIWFTKSPAALFVPSNSTTTIPYALGTSNFHYEMELVVAIGAPAFQVAPEEAMAAVYGYACGLDMTRRDLQNAAKPKGYPWDTAKNFENSAVIAAITPAAEFGPIKDQRIVLKLNDEVKQDSTLDEMTWTIPELIADLSRLYHLGVGDLIYTGTPAGVGPVVRGDSIWGWVKGLSPVLLHIQSTD